MLMSKLFDGFPLMELEEALNITGSLSEPGKMPGYSYSLPAEFCKVGAKLRKVKGSACEKCYCFNRGNYVYDNVFQSQIFHLAAIHDPKWVAAMYTVLLAKVKPSCSYFRWHDAGDLQGEWHLDKIVSIAWSMPEINFWLPTQERRMVKNYFKKYVKPHNLVIRISHAMKDGGPTDGFEHTSSIVSKPNRDAFEGMVDRNTSDAWACVAYRQGGSCGDCRACWDPDVPHIFYPEH